MNATPEEAKKSRWEQAMEGGEGSPFLILPPIEKEKYLVSLWEEAGVAGSNGMGSVPLSWQEIEAWLNVRKLKGELPLTAFEIDVVKMLSGEYVAESRSATSVDAPPPYSVSVEEMDRPAIANKLKGALSMFKKKPEVTEDKE